MLEFGVEGEPGDTRVAVGEGELGAADGVVVVVEVGHEVLAVDENLDAIVPKVMKALAAVDHIVGILAFDEVVALRQEAVVGLPAWVVIGGETREFQPKRFLHTRELYQIQPAAFGIICTQ